MSASVPRVAAADGSTAARAGARKGVNGGIQESRAMAGESGRVIAWLRKMIGMVDSIIIGASRVWASRLVSQWAPMATNRAA